MNKKVILGWDAEANDALTRDMRDDEKHLYFFGESVGILTFGQWFYNVAQMGHQTYAPTYDFPVRIKLIHDQFGPEGLNGGDPAWGGWNLPVWIQGAQELESEGVRAIVGGCGISGNIQSTLAAAVSIPVYTSTILFVPIVYRGLKPGQKVGILTVSAEMFSARDNLLLRECGVDDSIPVVVAGVNESEFVSDWLSVVTPDFDPEVVKKAIVNLALKMVSDNPDVGSIVIECTDMTPYSQAIRNTTGLPVLDAVDMVKWVHHQVKPTR